MLMLPTCLGPLSPPGTLCRYTYIKRRLRCEDPCLANSSAIICCGCGRNCFYDVI